MLASTSARQWQRMGTCLATALAANLISPAVQADDLPGAVQPNSGYGASYGEWAARWWEWALSIPVAENPIVDSSGTNCGKRQIATAWFLAGNFGGQTTRTCTIPAGKPVFFPILNNIAYDPKGNETTLDLRQLATNGLDGATLTCTLDGSPCAPGSLTDYRAQSPLFKAIVRTGSLLPPKTYDPLVADGYWLLLGPLDPGEHTLHFTGVNASGTFTTDITYTLTVE